MADARTELRELRRRRWPTIAAKHGLAILAAGTHPTGAWREVEQTPKERYDAVMDDLQMIGQRDMLCGMHVHVELPEPDRRVDVMCRMLPYLPLFLALSTSSPFWQSRRTGLKGYRLAAYDELPRTGVPELFRTQEEFDAYVVGAGARRRDGGFELSSGGRSGPRSSTRRWNCARPTAARWSRIRSRSRRSTARWRGTSYNNP